MDGLSGCSNRRTDDLKDLTAGGHHSHVGRERRMRLEKVGHYKIGQTLGRGNFATVRVGYHEIANARVAVKVVDRCSLNAEDMAKIEREVEILQRISHTHIVKLYEIIRTERYLYIITEYVANGELFDMLMERGRQTEDESRRLFQQIASAVLYCHANGIVHRDLKAENLLIDKKGNIKLIDFGFSNYQTHGQLLSTWCGSPPYAAPELLLAQAYDGRTSDVWSLGVILYILVTAGFPFPGESVDKLKRAVLGDHLKIPFWVSVECADLIRRMLTVSPAKRCTMQNVIQHRWFINKMPADIVQLINAFLAPTTTISDSTRQQNPLLNPTVIVFMQQHTKWSEEQINEEVSSGNYSSPIFATYELLLDKLSEFKKSESGSALLRLDTTETNRRGSRGSILSGKANIEPDATAATIPTHHLAKLSANIDDESDKSSTSDMCESSSMSLPPSKSPLPYLSAINPQGSSQAAIGGGSYKARRRRVQMLQDRQQQLGDVASGGGASNNRRHTLCATAAFGITPLNPLLSAAAQQFAVDTRAWANAAAAAAMFATQLHRQNHQQQMPLPQQQQQEQNHQQHLQQAALNLLSLKNFPLDYARIMNSHNQERRASANEALLGLNTHLLAACSTIGISTGAANSPLSDANSTSPTRVPSANPQKHPSVEEEGRHYLIERGNAKRNTVHAGSSSGSTSYRHGPYAKQNAVIVSPSVDIGSMSGSGGLGVNLRRSSWTLSGAAAVALNNELNISSQEQAQLERLYRQSIGSTGPTSSLTIYGHSSDGNSIGSPGASTVSNTVSGGNESMTAVQQLQLEFQKLCASATAKDAKHLHAQRSNSHMPISLSYNKLFSVINPLLDMQTPTISITDENNKSLTSPLYPFSSAIGFLASTSASMAPSEQRPATVIGFSSMYSSSVSSGNNTTVSMSSPANLIQSSPLKTASKFVYVPVSPVVALERLDRFVKVKKVTTPGIRYETQPVFENDVEDALRIRVTPDDGRTILEMALFPMPQSPNISKATFALVNGEHDGYNELRQELLAAFNEVY